MKNNNFNIYNNLIKLTRNKNLYINLNNCETFADRLFFLFLHFSILLKLFKKDIPKKELQELFDYIIRQIDLSIREIGFGDATVNKKMKSYINLLYSIIDSLEKMNNKNYNDKSLFLKKYLNERANIDFYVKYMDNYINFLLKSSLKMFTKDILDFNF